MKQIGLFFLALFATTVMAAEIGSPAPGFTLKDAEGTSHSLSDFKDKVVVLEWINYDCPFVRKHYDSQNMQNLQAKWKEQGVIWLAINSSNKGKQGHFEGDKLKKRIAKEKGNQTAYLLDTDGKVGKAYGARTTPHMFIIGKDGTLLYKGGIDDNPSRHAKDIPNSKNYVDVALASILAGEDVKENDTRPYGCSVKY